MNRSEWVLKTGLPPHLFEATKEELAWNIYLAQRDKDAKLTERRLVESSDLKEAIRADALKHLDGMILAARTTLANLVKEWERK